MLEANTHSQSGALWIQAYVENLPILTRFANKLTGCNHYAEDMVQDAFFRLSSAPPIASPKDQLSYLFQIIRNLAVDHYRKQAMMSKYVAPEPDDDSLTATDISPEIICEDQEALEQLTAALAELPERTRYAFERHRIYGVPQKEVAKELGVSPTLVNFMIRDALVHCSKIL